MSAKAKRFKKSEPKFKSKGNKAQFEHQQSVFDRLNEAKESSACATYEKAKKALEESITFLENRIKVIKLADRSELGWSTVKVFCRMI